MGIFNWLFRRASVSDPDETAAEPTAPKRGLFEDFLDLPARNFFGRCTHSPNGRYTLGWRDANDAGSHGGARSRGLGRFILLDGRNVLAEGQMARPNDGKVANNGTFILNDWEFTGGLSGIFSAFRSNGAKILSRRFEANLYNNGLASDGRFAVCQTCNSPDPEDGSVLVVFDLNLGIEIAAWYPESGWASAYEFPSNNDTVRLRYPDGSAYIYSLDGKFIDRRSWIETELGKGNLHLVERLLKAAENGVSAKLANRLTFGIDVALCGDAAADSKTRAWGLKLRGMCLEAQSDAVQALSCYEAALALDPKIGVKRRVDQLRKMLGT
jgi:hypothetical protein